jgi:hypothetical protein
MSQSLKRNEIIKLLLMILVVCGSGHIALCERMPDAEQVAKLVAAVWKDEPKSIDATIYKTITRPAKSNQQIREEIEDSFAKDRSRILQRYEPDSRARTIMLDKLNHMIEMNVERITKEQQTPRRIKERIRISNGRERRDIAYARTPDVLVGPNTPFESSSVDLGKHAETDIKAFSYHHDTKTANIDTSGWASSHIEDFTGLPHAISLGWKTLLGKRTSSGLYVPDSDKVQEIERTGLFLDRFPLVIGPDPNAPATRDRIEGKDPEFPGGPVLICDRDDYSRVYCIRSYQHKTGRLLRVRESSNFDSQGFPHNVTVIEYDADGKLKKKEVYTFEKVVLNPAIPDEVFEFRPPEGYKVNDRRPKNPETEKPAPEPTPSP